MTLLYCAYMFRAHVCTVYFVFITVN